jgi:pimeloyl-ACP methyl ester carboxylesterase
VIIARTDDGLDIAGDRFGDGERTVIFAHGGGQTRHAWGGTARAVAQRGWSAITFDLRGHGESDRAPDGTYTLDGFVADVAAVAAAVASPPVLVGASLGGAASLLYVGEGHGAARARALVLVDIGVRARDEGVARIVGFMQRHVEGFASLEEAVAAVAAYAPRVGRSPRTEGLRKNLRLDPDGRYRWHWDPALLDAFDFDQVTRNARVEAALRALTIPMTVVHGGRSDVLDAATADETARLGHGTVTSVGDAAHMVAGDANDAFTGALLEFLATL